MEAFGDIEGLSKYLSAVNGPE